MPDPDLPLTVGTLLARHLHQTVHLADGRTLHPEPCPPDAEIEAQAKALYPLAPADLSTPSLARWFDGMGIPAGERHRAKLRHRLVCMRLGDSFRNPGKRFASNP